MRRKEMYPEEEDISALHAGVHDLGGRQFIRLTATHDGAAAEDTLEIVFPGYVHDQLPVHIRPRIDLC